MTTQVDVALADVDPGRSERDETVDLGCWSTSVGRSDVEVQPVLPDLRGDRRTTQVIIGPVPSGARIAVSSS